MRITIENAVGDNLPRKYIRNCSILCVDTQYLSSKQCLVSVH